MPRRGGPGFHDRPSFFDNVAAVAGNNYLREIDALTARQPLVTYNRGYWNSEIGQRELQQQWKNANDDHVQKMLEGYKAQDQINAMLTGKQSLTSAGAAADAENATGPVSNPFGQEWLMTGNGQAPASAYAGPKGQVIENPFASRDPRVTAAADAMEQFDQQQAHKAVREYAEIGRALSRGATPRQLEQAKQEFKRRYPWFTADVQPLTSKQAAQLEQKLMVQEEQSRLDGFAQKLGVPAPPLTLNEKGQVDVPPGYSEMLRVASEMRMKERDANYQMREIQQRMLKEKLDSIPAPAKPDEWATEQEKANYAAKMQEVHQQRLQIIEQEIYGTQAAQAPAPQGVPMVIQNPFAPPPPSAPAPVAQQPAAIPTIMSEQEYMNLPAGSQFYWNGQLLRKN